jgi:uncharacterized protein involved in response to NO
MVVWLPLFYGELSLRTAFAPRDWHAHELLYGYLPAVITGFLLTAIPNWTGRLPLQGAPLLCLVVAWLVGRLAVAFSADLDLFTATILDSAFLLLVIAATAREIIAGSNWRNLKVLVPLAVLGAGNILFHIETYASGAADISIRIGEAAVLLLITIIGGRIIPSFTRNWLARENPGRMPVSFGHFDAIVIAISVAALVLWIAQPLGTLTGFTLIAASVMQAIRLGRWAGGRTTRARLVLVLHLAYLFLPLGFFLTGLAAFKVVLPSAGTHAWMSGGAGLMTLAVMTRASLGHTGRALNASRGTQTIYVFALIAASTRVLAALLPDWTHALLHVAAFAWIAAFGGFCLVYGPMLLRPRIRMERARG